MSVVAYGGSTPPDYVFLVPVSTRDGICYLAGRMDDTDSIKYLHANFYSAFHEALVKIRDEAKDQFICECEHGNENCCAIIGEYCPVCIAACALKEKR